MDETVSITHPKGWKETASQGVIPTWLGLNYLYTLNGQGELRGQCSLGRNCINQGYLEESSYPSMVKQHLVGCSSRGVPTQVEWLQGEDMPQSLITLMVGTICSVICLNA